MTRISFALMAALSLAACKGADKPIQNPIENAMNALPEGFTLVETVERSGDDIVIPYKKYTLSNGLTVILHEDDSDPLVHVDVTYHVGSGREDIGRSGFAHFFEHMMFQGSENVGDEQHFKIISEAGGTLNGTTNSDRTNYFETVPNNQLEKMLWLEADRMGFLLDAVTQEKFEVQRDTVKNERGQRVDNAPYGLRGERLGEAMFPEGHPYSWSVIGYLEDLDRADLADLKRFFLRWYGPNNATLTIGGKLDEKETLAWVGKYFGTIPRGPEVDSPKAVPVTLDSDRYISFEDNIALPLIELQWPTVHARHADEAPLDVLMSILGDGKTSLLYKNLVKPGYAVEAQAGHGCRELSCEFSLLALPAPDGEKSLADLETLMRESLAEFEERGAQPDDLARVKAGIVSSMVYGLESVRSKVSTLAANQTFTGDANYIGKDIARYENVTAEDVMRVYTTYIKDKPSVILSIVQKGKPEQKAHEDTWDRYQRDLPERGDEGELAMRKATDGFDRSIQPSPSNENPTLTLPTIWRSKLDNGVTVLGAANTETPTTAIELRIEAGQRNEALEQLGLAGLTATMLNQATSKRTNEELSNDLAKLGSSVSFSAGDEAISLSISSLTKNLDETLAIAAERLLHPKFDEADFDRERNRTLQGIEVAKRRASAQVSVLQRKMLFGADNAFAHPNDGTTETVSKLTLADAKAHYGTWVKPSAASVIAVSNLSEEMLMAKLTSAFGEWSGTSPESVAHKPYPELSAGTLYLLDKPGAAQSEIRIGRRALAFDAVGQHQKARLMNYPLGGAFNSRININLREDKGYTYGARSSFRGAADYGWFSAGAGVRTDSTKASLVEFYKEIESYHADGITEDELAFTKASIGQSEARSYETPRQKIGFLEKLVVYNLPDDIVDQQTSLLKTVTKADLDMLSTEWLDINTMITVVIGDASVIEESLKELDMPIVRIDEAGNPLP